MSNPSLSALHIYPMKSAAGISLNKAWSSDTGLLFDRQFMLMERNGRFITARRFAKIQQVAFYLHPLGVQVHCAGMPTLEVRYQDFSAASVDTKVWDDSFQAQATHEHYDTWFSTLLGIDCQLLYIGKDTQRHSSSANHPASFADGFPLLLISQASLEDLNQRTQTPHVMAQFRPNLVVSGCAPYAEDTWRLIRIGGIEFEVREPCARCIMTTIDPISAERHALREPLSVLEQYRKDADGDVMFGQNLVARSPGPLHVGDRIEVLETGPAPAFV